MKKIIAGDDGSMKKHFFLFLVALIIIGFIVPTIIFHSPNGSDVYTHVYNTEKMAGTNSLFAFYEISFHEEYLGYDYPFGLWFFGSILIKVTGLDGLTLSYLLPVILMLISILLFYNYSDFLLKSKEMAILSGIFLVSMPLIALNLLNYSTSKFVMVFLITILYLSIQKTNPKNLFIVILLVFTLCFTHTGTYMFLIFFGISYLLIYAIIWKKFDISMYFLTVSTLFTYVLIVQLFPFVQPQYIDKGRFIITTTESISSFFNIELIKEFGIIFYESLFVSNNFIYALFWSSLIFMAVKLCLYLHSGLDKIRVKNNLALPFIGGLTDISHGIITTPLWIGPVQTFLAIPGFFKLDRKGKCIGLALLISAFLPGAMKSAEKTGALREIYYLYLIVPVAAAAGFYYLIPLISEYLERKNSSDFFRSGIFAVLFMIIFVPLIVAPVVGSLYYQPIITGSETEKENLMWLNDIGDSLEGACSFGYRERIDLYADKITPSIYSGAEMSRYLDDLEYTYFFSGTEEYTKDLYSYNIKYVFVSDRILKGYNELGKSDLRIDSNRELDKIFSSAGDFGIYSYINPVETLNKSLTERQKLVFKDFSTGVREFGSAYLFENEYYKVKMSEYSPEIKYIGTKTKSLLGEGYFSDLIGISWSNSPENEFGYYYLDELEYSEILLGNNTIIYKTVLDSPDNDQEWATLNVKYTFFEKAFKREIFVANDRFRTDVNSKMILRFSDRIYADMLNFEYLQIDDGNEEEKNKIIYPSQDSVRLSDKKIKQIFFNEGSTGFMIRYGENLPYPDSLTYGGSAVYDVGHASVSAKYTLSASETANIVQYFSVGEKKAAENNIDGYSSVSFYPFSGGRVPVIVCGIAYGGGEISGVDPFESEIIYNSIIEDPELIKSGCKDNIVSFLRVTENNTFKDSETLCRELNNLKEATDSKGVLFSSYVYNLDAISAMAENNFDYLFANYVSAPVDDLFREGIRIPKNAYLSAKDTGVVLLPVTRPSSSVLRGDYDEDSAFESWKNTMDSAVEDDGIAIFMWDKEDLNNLYYMDKFKELYEYARKKGMYFTTPDEIASYYRLIQNIYAEVQRGNDHVTLNVYNNNDNNIDGATYKLKLPLIDNNCQYIVRNGNISRQLIEDDVCVLYITFDICPYENKIISVEPNLIRNEFQKDIPELYEGNTRIVIRDINGLPVSGAHVTLGSKLYESDENGEVEINSGRGLRQVIIEKPGFVTAEYLVEVYGRIYSILP